MNYWLVKSEPGVYSIDQFEKDKKTCWDGIRNYAARLHLRAMKKGDLVLFYHSNKDKKIVGLGKVAGEAYQDPTTTEDWSAVDLAFVSKLPRPLALSELKKDALLKNMKFVIIGRLSVSPVSNPEMEKICALSGLKI
jgi:predicted RNA-binding protein with PUA-like domain